MTENTVTETPDATPDAPAWEPPAGPAQYVLQDLNEKVASYNDLQKRLTAATGDNSALVSELLESSENEKVRALMDKVDDLILKAEKARKDAEELVKADLAEQASFTPEQIEAAKADLKKQRETINAGRNYLKGQFGEVALTAVSPMVGAKREASGKGAGGIKPRVTNIYVNGEVASAEVKNAKTGETKVVSTFTLAAKKIPGATVPLLQEAWLDQAGVEKWEDAANVVEFVITGGDDANYTVRVEK